MLTVLPNAMLEVCRGPACVAAIVSAATYGVEAGELQIWQVMGEAKQKSGSSTVGSIRPESLDRVDTRGAAGGKVSGQQCAGKNRDDHDDEGAGVG